MTTIRRCGLVSSHVRKVLPRCHKACTVTVDWMRFADFVRDEIVDAVERFVADDPGCRPQRAAIHDLHTAGLVILFPTIAVARPGTEDNWSPNAWALQRDSSRKADRWAARLTAHAGSGWAGWPDVIHGFRWAIAAGCRVASAELIESGLVAEEFVAVACGDDELVAACLTPARLSREFPEIAARRHGIARTSTLDAGARGSRVVAQQDATHRVGTEPVSFAMLDSIDLTSVTDSEALGVIAEPYLGTRKNGRLTYRPLERIFVERPRLHDRLMTRLTPAEMYPIDADDLPVAVAALSSCWPFIRRHAAIVLLSVHL